MPTSSNPPALRGAAELAGPSVCLFLLPRATARGRGLQRLSLPGTQMEMLLSPLSIPVCRAGPAVGLSAGSRAEPGVPPGICCGSDMFYTC